MDFQELKNKMNKFYPAIILDEFISYSKRNIIRKILLTISLFLLLVVLFTSFSFVDSLINLSWYDELLKFKFKIRGLFSIFVALTFYMFLEEFFYRSFYFKKDSGITFALAKIIYKTKYDVTKVFLESDLGKYALMRCGIFNSEIRKFLENREYKINPNLLKINIDDSEKIISIVEYGKSIYSMDEKFVKFLNKFEVNQEIFIGALKWVSKNEIQIHNSERWWNKDNLVKIKSFGANWAFGETYLLEKYGKIIYEYSNYKNIGSKWRIYQDDVKKIEQSMMRIDGANSMIITPVMSIGMNIIYTFGKMIMDGRVSQNLERKRIFILDHSILFSSFPDVKNLENEIIKIFNQAAGAGNVILVIPNFANFITKGKSISLDLSILLDDYLKSTKLNLIAISESNQYYSELELKHGLMTNFEKILVEDFDENSSIDILMSEANILESEEDVFFLYDAINAIAKGANRYYSNDIFSDKVIDLLNESVTMVKSKKQKIITKQDVNRIIKEKTGIDIGEIKESETESLMNLEEDMHKRVVGQKNAISSIANVIRRSRAGLSDEKKPIGSFMFFGPTGVGKTETVKTLAETFFQNEENIIRFDMSEYSDNRGLSRLIGDGENIGNLSKEILKKQYGILLLDEFEKSNSEVLDLFLQIIDEGFFTNYRGQKINCRNLIIIATSNAGSDLIFNYVKNGAQKLQENKELIIEKIISRGIYKPELLNRFDNIVMFHPLKKEHLKKIADLMIGKLNKKLENKRIFVESSHDLINYLSNIGLNPKFGAREMNRVIQDNLENEIVNGLLTNKIKSGDVIRFAITSLGPKIIIK